MIPGMPLKSLADISSQIKDQVIVEEQDTSSYPDAYQTHAKHKITQTQSVLCN